MIEENQLDIRNMRTEHEPIPAVCKDINLVQAATLSAQSFSVLTAQLVEVEGDEAVSHSLVIKIMGECVPRRQWPSTN